MRKCLNGIIGVTDVRNDIMRKSSFMVTVRLDLYHIIIAKRIKQP